MFFMVLGALSDSLVSDSRSALSDFFGPILSVLNAPIEALNDAVAWSGNAVYVMRENDRLSEDNRRLKEWLVTAQRLATENERLRALLKLQDPQATLVASARIVGQSAGNYVRTVLVSAGQNAGVARGHVAADGEGVLGQVIEVGQRTSRILLLTDLNSRIQVKLLPSGINAIWWVITLTNHHWPFCLPIPTGIAVGIG